MSATLGIHHVTAIAGPPQPNVDFYTGFLGLRLVKKTVNFDDPGTYHLYYGDAVGHPGSILTFFPWPDARPGRSGPGMTTATAFAIPADAFDAWVDRFADEAEDFDGPDERFGARVLRFQGPDGLPLELVAADVGGLDGWDGGPVPASHAIRGFHSVTLASMRPDATAAVLTDVLGFEAAGDADGRLRFQASSAAIGGIVDLDTTLQAGAGRSGAGTVHHVAFRAADDEHQQALRAAVAGHGLQVTQVLDRQYFRSIYFREPGGVLFEVATDPPGFTRDESVEALGTGLKLPPWLEPQRERIEARLVPLE